MEYREASVSDLKGILNVYSQINPEEKQLSPDKAGEIWKKIEANPGYKYFVAVDNGKVVSTCNISIIPNLTRQGRSFGVIENVGTDIAYRKKGLGKAVVGMAIDYARKKDCYKILLLSSLKRTGSHIFYEKIGFNGNSKKGFEMRLSQGLKAKGC
jgi:predicted N-acetyltransferase YhbS